MNVAAKLAGFALVLVVLFGGGFALGRAVGPVGAGAPPPAGAPTTPSTTHTGGHP